MTSRKVKALGADGVTREFWFRIQPNAMFETNQLFARPVDEVVQDEFELVLREDSTGLLRVKMMNHHGQELLSQKGVPDAALIHASEMLNMPIESGPTIPDGNEWRTEAATKVWERLRLMGKALYNPETGRYRTVVTKETLVI